MRNEMRDFRADRIVRLEITAECASEKRPGELKKYFHELWLSSDLFEVKVWFDQSVISLLKSTKYYFGYIDEYPEGEGIVMSFAVDDFHYIGNWLLSFGDQIKILEPDELKVKITDHVKILTKAYLNKK